MKKRVLSMLLAFALCIAVLPGFSVGAASMDALIAKAGNVLDGATEGQRTALNAVAQSDKVSAPASMEDPDWAAFVEALIQDENLNDDNVVAYFIIRYLQANPDLIADSENLQAVVAALEAADVEIDTSTMGFLESVNSFDAYVDKLTDAAALINADGFTKLEELGLADSAAETLAINPDVDAFLRDEVVKSLELVKKIAFAASKAELEAAYDAFMADDIAKKCGAILIGKDLLKAVATDITATAKNFAKDNKSEIVDIFNSYKGTVASEGALAAAEAAQAAGAEMATLFESVTDGKIGNINTLLAAKGLTATQVKEALVNLADALDPTGVYQAVNLDLAVAKLVTIEPTKVQSGQNFNIKLWNSRLANYGINEKYDVTDLFYVATNSDKVSAVLTEDNSYQLIFGSDAPASVELTLYRNSAVADEMDPLRYVTTKTMELEVPTPAEKSITVDGIDGREFATGESIVIKGEATGFDEVVVAVINGDAENVEDAAYYATVAAEKYTTEGVSVALDKAGTYTVIVGDNEKSAKATFTVVATVEKTIAITSPADGAKLASGEVTIKGTSTGFEEIVVSIVKPGETEAVYYGTLTADKYATDGVVLNLTELGSYTVIVGDAAVNTKVSFEIVSESEKTIAITSPTDGGVYEPGEITIKGTSAGFEEIAVSVIKGGDTKAVYYGTIGADKYATDGIVLNLTELGEYTVIAGDDEVNATVAFTISLESYEKFVNITKTGINAEYLPGETVVIKGTSKNFDEIVVSIIKPDGQLEYYGTYSPEKFAAGVEVTLPENAALGEYKILVGETGENTASVIHNDSVSFNVVESHAEAVKLVSESYSPKSVTFAKNGTFDKLLSKLPKQVTLKAENGTKIKVNITWDATTSGYNPSATGKQTIYGYYDIPEGYVGGDAVDGRIEVEVKRSSGGSGGGSGSSSYINFYNDEVEDKVFAGQSVVIKGAVKGYDTVTVTITKPDGTKETIKVSAEDFKNGYGYPLTTPGEYVIEVNGRTAKVLVEKVSSDIFEKTKHVNYILGYEDGTIRPEANVTREEITTILFRLLADDSREAWLTESTDKFSDVEEGRWSMTSIATLNKIGILNGYEDGTFRPDASITRAEFAALLSRLVQVKPAATEVDYKDIDGHWAASDIRLVSAEGWFEGDNDGNFRPNDKITRAEAVTVMNRVLGRDNVLEDTIKNVEIVEFTDLKADVWYYVDMVEATNAHSFTKDADEKESWVKAEEVADWAAFED